MAATGTSTHAAPERQTLRCFWINHDCPYKVKNTMTRATTGQTTCGVHHIGLTVPDVGETTTFFVDVLGYKLTGTRESYPATFVSDGTTTVSLWQTTDPKNATGFDRKTVIGLHHLAIAVENHATLELLYRRLRTTPGVHMEFAPEQQGNGNNRHMMCSIPSGIRVEFIAPK